MRCDLCNGAIGPTERIIEWEPTYFDGDREVFDAICPGCVQTFCRLRENGQPELIVAATSSASDPPGFNFGSP